MGLMKLPKACEAGVSHKAWERKPKEQVRKNREPANAGDSADATEIAIMAMPGHRVPFRPPTRATDSITYADLGFRSAPPQALCCRLLRRLVVSLQFRIGQ